jgi:hypothetical protein
METVRDYREDTKHCYQGEEDRKGRGKGEGKNGKSILLSFLFFLLCLFLYILRQIK